MNDRLGISQRARLVVAVVLSFTLISLPYRSSQASDFLASDGLPSGKPRVQAKIAPLSPPPTCRTAIDRAEQRYATPAGLLTAIAIVETGQRDARTGQVNPWPWSVNAENMSFYFPTQGEAITWVKQAQARGTASIDVGCMQINLFYHPQAFASLEEAFDPIHNADYAARFLTRLCSESGSWQLATGYYHSRTPDLAIYYRQQVASAFSQFTQAVAVVQQSLLPGMQLAWGATLAGPNRAPHGTPPIDQGERGREKTRDKLRQSAEPGMVANGMPAEGPCLAHDATSCGTRSAQSIRFGQDGLHRPTEKPATAEKPLLSRVVSLSQLSALPKIGQDEIALDRSRLAANLGSSLASNLRQGLGVSPNRTATMGDVTHAAPPDIPIVGGSCWKARAQIEVGRDIFGG